jgi:acyl-CoA reductase-like NAD-dependent aldehyde dehydrogenase
LHSGDFIEYSMQRILTLLQSPQDAERIQATARGAFKDMRATAAEQFQALLRRFEKAAEPNKGLFKPADPDLPPNFANDKGRLQ